MKIGFIKYLILLFILFSFLNCKSKNQDDDFLKMFGKMSEIEDNNTFKNANQILIDKPITGFFSEIEKGFDVDFYKIKSTGRDNSYEIVISPVPDVDSKLTFYDEKQKMLFTLDEKGNGEGEKLWEFSFYSDTIFLKVESKNGSNEKIPYVINFIKKETSYSEIEPNNTEKDAIEIKLNQTKEAFISPKSDIDYYKLVFDSEFIYDFYVEIETLSNLDINFIIIEKRSNMIKTINSEGFGGTEISPYLSSNKGEYFIKVSGKINASDKKPPIYYISVKELKSTVDDKEYYYEREINDIEAFSTELISNVELVGNIYPEGDIDWYHFSLFKKPISVDLVISETKGVDFIIELYDNNKNLIKTINNNQKDKGEQTSIKDIETGKYFVKISGNGNSRLLYKLYYYVRY
ncbi:MAG TPA: hypothetical protein PK771_02045 [Spirochaetota bacterium]|nr:hypothetical protein [Spirochaetota bacterium]